MRKLTAFINVSLDGYYAGPKGDISWFHKSDDEWNAFVESNSKGGGVVVFGRVTYQLMASYWPTPVAMQNDPVVAKQMNDLPKIVFSKKLRKATWNNTTLIKGDMIAKMKKLKQEPGPDMVTLGSGNVVSQLVKKGLVDELQLVVNPLLLGKGKKLFDDIKTVVNLKLTNARTFKNGNVVLYYHPAS